MSLSSSLPGHMILPFHSAWMCATAVMSHIMTRKIVNALQMPLIPGLFRAEPTWIAARVRPALGKTNFGDMC
jgi:ABC-type transport system involved in cytochrome c biogenesis permease component